MCTHIAESTGIQGMGKGPDGWFELNKVTVGYDHTTHSVDEHALLLDFTNYDLGVGARVALEIDLESGRALLAQLTEVIERAEATGLS